MSQRLPKSKAKNAYDLLTDICRFVRDEPKRLDMTMPLTTDAGFDYGDTAPACGTVGCVAGWTVMLKGDPSNPIPTTSQGAHILGLSEGQAHGLFYVFPATERGDTLSSIRRHAREEIVLIRRFQKKHEKQLKAQAV